MQVKKFFDAAFLEAKKSLENGEVPIGCVVVYKNKIIARTHNQNIKNNNATDHAEILAIKEASKILGTRYLDDCDLFVTLEPCAMCSGAIGLARLRRVYFAINDKKFGGMKLFLEQNSFHKPEIYGGFFEEKARLLLQDFFQNKR